MNNNTNPNLPAHAIRTTDVREGMVIVKDGYIVTVTKVVWYGHNGIITTDLPQRIRVNAAGTMRLGPTFVD